MLSGSYDVGKFAVSVEAKNSFHYAKAQLLFILIQTLDFESLLRMVRDEVPFRYLWLTWLFHLCMGACHISILLICQCNFCLRAYMVFFFWSQRRVFHIFCCWYSWNGRRSIKITRICSSRIRTTYSCLGSFPLPGHVPSRK